MKPAAPDQRQLALKSPGAARTLTRLLHRAHRRHYQRWHLASAISISGDMARTIAVRRAPRGRGARVVPAFRVEVTARHKQPAPWGWQVFRRGQTRPAVQSA